MSMNAPAFGMLILTALLVQAAGGQAQDTAPQPRAIDSLLGNTILYPSQSLPAVETGLFLRPDGTGFTGPAGAATGQPIRWAQRSDGQVCLYPNPQTANEGLCGRLDIGTDKGRFTLPDGKVIAFAIMAGDGWDLDPSLRGATRVEGHAAIGLLAGNTLVFGTIGSSGPERSAFHFLQDGTLRAGLIADDSFEHWQLQPDESWRMDPETGALCIDGPRGPAPWCMNAAVEGDLVVLSDKTKGVVVPARLLDGDARLLSPQAQQQIAAQNDRLRGHTLVLPPAALGAKDSALIHFGADGAGFVQRDSAPPLAMTWQVLAGDKLCMTPRQKAARTQDCIPMVLQEDRLGLTFPGTPAVAGRLVAATTGAP